MTGAIENILPLMLAQGGHAAAGPVMAPWWAPIVIWLPAASAILCGLCAATKVRNKLPGWITVAFLGASFALVLALWMTHEGGAPAIAHIFDWFNIYWGDAPGEPGRSLVANFALHIDSLTLLWMLFVTGLGTLIALYATEYMEADVRGAGYSRFFAGVSIFLFAMSCLVMADNLVLLYLGWEGVGLASYLLIGYYYRKPSAVAAAKKAFIMNRIGDLGLALGIWLIYHNFGTVEYRVLFDLLASNDYRGETMSWTVEAIPYLLMLGAFGKSAQIPLYVWLPDAMEGPTPVSALIHAATMVTAGVYLLCRMFPVMLLSEAALPTVAWIGGLTALLAATIGMAQYDFKRIWAYSTVSQLGYMFVGVGVMTTYGAAYHVFTHAFFKAVLFLTAGAVMHGFAGQLDLRKVSGLGKMPGWKITTFAMLIGCLCLAGFPGSSGYFSKDAILAEIFTHSGGMYQALGWIALITAGLTAYYTFRVFFRVCMGPVHYEPGDDHHDAEAEHGAAHEPAPAHQAHGFHPHAPRLAINFVLVVLAIGAILAAVPYFMQNEYEEAGVHGGWVADMVYDSSARIGIPGVGDGHTDAPGHEAEGAHAAAGEPAAAHGSILGFDPHAAMYFISGAIGLIGILVAVWLHWLSRPTADAIRGRLLSNRATRWLPIAMEHKWFVDEIYHAAVRLPLWILGHVLSLFDKIVIDVIIVDGAGRLPRWIGKLFQPLQSGILHDYAKTMAGAAILVVLFVWMMESGFVAWLTEMLGGGDAAAAVGALAGVLKGVAV